MTRIDAGMKQRKILAVATQDSEFSRYGKAREMPHRLLMLRRFFQDSKQLEGKAVEIDDPGLPRPPSSTMPHRYNEQRRRGFKGIAGVHPTCAGLFLTSIDEANHLPVRASLWRGQPDHRFCGA